MPVVVAQFAFPTSTGNVEWTTTDLGGATPVAAIFVHGETSTDDTDSYQAPFTIGYLDGTNEYFCSGHSRHSNTKSSEAHSYVDDHCLGFYNYLFSDSTLDNSATGAGDGTGSNPGFITNGVRLNFDNVEGNALKCMVIFFYGDNCSAVAGIFNPNETEDDTTTVSGLGIDPDLLFFLHPATGSTGNKQHNNWSSGVCDANLNQASFGIHARNSQSTSVTNGIVSNARAALQTKFDGTIVSTIEITSVSSGEFVATTRDDDAGAHDIVYLAIDFGGDDVAEVFHFDTPTTAASTWTVSGLGVAPDALITVQTMYTAYSNTSETDGLGVFLGATDGSNEYGFGPYNEDNAGTTNTSTRTAANMFWADLDDGTDLFNATSPSFTSDGWTVSAANITTANATARKCFGVAIAAAVSGVTLTAAGLDSVVALDASTITATASLTSDAMDVLAVFDASSLTASTSLTTDALDVLAVFDDSSLTATASLTAAGLDSIVALDASTLTALANLTSDALDVLAVFDASSLTAFANLVSDEITVAVVFDATTITTGISLAPAELLVLTTLDATTLQASTSLTTDALDVEVFLDSTTILTTTSLSVDELTVEVLLDTSAIATGLALSVDDLTTIIALDTASLTPAVSFSADSLDAFVVFDSPTLTPTTSLTTDALDVLVAFDASTIVTGLVLSTDSLDVLVVLDASTVAGSVSVAPDDLVSIVAFDGATLTAFTTLTTDSLDTLVVFDSPTLTPATSLTSDELDVSVVFDGATATWGVTLAPDELNIPVTFDTTSISVFVTLTTGDMVVVVALDGTDYTDSTLILKGQGLDLLEVIGLDNRFDVFYNRPKIYVLGGDDVIEV